MEFHFCSSAAVYAHQDGA